MKTVTEYLLPKPGDPDRVFLVEMPRTCRVEIYRPEAEDEDWRVVVKLRAIDVKTDDFAVFQTRWSTTHEPTRDEIAQVVINALAHEAQEQLGIDPHNSGVVIPGPGNR